jgi:hypothetical protein
MVAVIYETGFLSTGNNMLSTDYCVHVVSNKHTKPSLLSDVSYQACINTEDNW